MPKVSLIIIIIFLSVLFSKNIADDWENAIYHTRLLTFQVNTFSSGYEIPWGMAFLPNGELLVTDISGSLWRISSNGDSKREIKNTPRVYYKGQGGLLDIQIHPKFKENKLIYLSYSDLQFNNRSNTTIARAILDDNSLKDFQILYQAPENLFTKTSRHFGSRIIFDDTGYLYFSIGDRGARNQAQDISLPNGKIHRVNDDGTIPIDNPFYNQADAVKTVWTFGNRNPQG